MTLIIKKVAFFIIKFFSESNYQEIRVFSQFNKTSLNNQINANTLIKMVLSTSFDLKFLVTASLSAFLS